MCGILRENSDSAVTSATEVAYDDESARNGIYMSQEILSCLFITKCWAGNIIIYLPYLFLCCGPVSYKTFDSVDGRLQRTHILSKPDVSVAFRWSPTNAEWKCFVLWGSSNVDCFIINVCFSHFIVTEL